MKLSAFKTNTTLESNGVWVDIGDGAQVRVARFGNAAYKKALDTLLKPHRNALRAGIASDDVTTDAVRRAMSRHILLDWRGITDDAGQPIAFSQEAAYDALGIRDFSDLISELAASAETFREVAIREEAETLGNE